jgi:hypothetical protein
MTLRYPFVITRTRTGDSNPNWKTQIARQENATTDLNGTFDTFRCSKGEAEVTWKGYYGNANPVDKSKVVGDILGNNVSAAWVPAITTTVADNRALIAYLKDVSNKKSSFNGLTFMGEMRESFRMIRHPLQGLANLANSWIKRAGKAKRDSPRNWKKNLSSLWLEQAFGWQPLVNDVNSFYKTYKELHDRKSQLPVSGFGKEEMVVRQHLNGPYLEYIDGPNSCLAYVYYLASKEIAVVKYRGMVKLKSTGTLAGTLEPFGFSFEQFIPTAWELLPWSFLIDYFTNAGDVITAGSVHRGDIAWTNKSTVVITTSQLNGSLYTNAQNNSLGGNFIASSGGPVEALATRRRVNRLRFTPLGIPTFTFEIPGRPAQWANMTALFASAASIHPQRYRR